MSDDPSRVEDLCYYLNLASGRGYSGGVMVWMNDGRITRSTFKKLRQRLALVGIPTEGNAAPTEEIVHA